MNRYELNQLAKEAKQSCISKKDWQNAYDVLLAEAVHNCELVECMEAAIYQQYGEEALNELADNAIHRFEDREKVRNKQYEKLDHLDAKTKDLLDELFDQ